MDRDRLIMQEFRLKIKLQELKARKKELKTRLETQTDISKEDKKKWKLLKQVYKRTKDEYDDIVAQLEEYESEASDEI